MTILLVISKAVKQPSRVTSVVSLTKGFQANTSFAVETPCKNRLFYVVYNPQNSTQGQQQSQTFSLGHPPLNLITLRLNLISA